MPTMDLTELDLVLQQLADERSRIGPSHMDQPLFGLPNMAANAPQSLNVGMAAQQHNTHHRSLSGNSVFTPFSPHGIHDMASHLNGHQDLRPEPTMMGPSMEIFGPSAQGPGPRDTGQFYGPRVSNSFAEHPLTPTMEAPHYNLDAQMSVFGNTNVQPYYYADPVEMPEPFTLHDLYSGNLGTAPPSASNRSFLPPNSHSFEHLDFSVFSNAFMTPMSSASAERSQQELASFLAESAFISSTQHDSSASPVLRTPSNGTNSNGSSSDNNPTPSVLIDSESERPLAFIDGVSERPLALRIHLTQAQLFRTGNVSPTTEESGATQGLNDEKHWPTAPPSSGEVSVERSNSASPVQQAASEANTPRDAGSPSSVDAHPTEDPRVLKFNMDAREKFHCYICDETYHGAVIFG
jgi:hypothetical protein